MGAAASSFLPVELGGVTGRSVSLRVGSDLYKAVMTMRERLRRAGAKFKERVPHIDLSDGSDSAATVAARARELQGKPVEIKLQRFGRAIAIMTPAVSGYGVTHITVAFSSAMTDALAAEWIRIVSSS